MQIADKKQFSRIRIKGTDVARVVPTVPDGNIDFIDTTMKTTDLLERELFTNPVDHKLYIRLDNKIFEIFGLIEKELNSDVVLNSCCSQNIINDTSVGNIRSYCLNSTTGGATTLAYATNSAQAVLRLF